MRKIIFFTILILLVGLTGYIYWYYYNPSSDNGYREGLVQKFSHKGSIFKTYEGEMVLVGFGMRNGNLNSNNFYFSVTDEKVADSMQKCLGKIVKLHYVQYRRSLPWRGENYSTKNQETGQYIVDRIDQVKEPSGNMLY